MINWLKKFDSGLGIKLDAGDVCDIILDNFSNSDIIEVVSYLCDERVDTYLKEDLVWKLNRES